MGCGGPVSPSHEEKKSSDHPSPAQGPLELSSERVNLVVYSAPRALLEFLAELINGEAERGWVLHYDFLGSAPLLLDRLSLNAKSKLKVIDAHEFCKQTKLLPLPPLSGEPSCVIVDSIRGAILSLASGLRPGDVPLLTLFYLLLLTELLEQLKIRVVLCEYEIWDYGRWLLSGRVLERLRVNTISLENQK